jgi:phage shock protein PspC (stress-responsive transcriptional regulator)
MIGGMNEQNESKRLVRTRNGRMLAGVCSGIAAYTGIDVNVIRVVFAVLGLLAWGVLIYLAAWIVIPEEGEGGSIAENLINKTRS